MKKIQRIVALLISILCPTFAYADPGDVTLAAALLAAADTAVAVIVANYIIIAEVALAVYGAVAARRRAAQAAAEARDKYNSNLIDRVATVVTPNPPWRVVYGNCITGGDIVAIFTSDKTATRSDGSTYVKPDSYKHLVIHVATHQIQAFKDTIVAGIRLGTLTLDGWVESSSAGTGEGYSISSNCQIGETQIPLAGGTGTILVGDSIAFVGDPTRYTVINNPGSGSGGITGSGQTLTIADPGLVVLTTSGTFADLGHEFSKPQILAHSIQCAASGTAVVSEPVHEIISSYYSTGDGGTQTSVTVELSDDRLTITNPVAFLINIAYTTLEVNPTVRVSYHLGTPDQTVDTYLTGIAPVQWDSTHRLRGVAYAVVTLDLEDVRFQGGPPQISFDVSGALVFDPRTSATAFSSNPALICRDFLTKNYGFGCATSDIDDSYVIAAANACDASTTFSMIDVLGSTVTSVMPQYTANGSFTTADTAEATLTNIATAMAGTVSYGGQWLIMAGVWSASVMDLSDDDLDGQISVVQAGTGLDELFNGCHATYMPVNRISPQDITPFQNLTFLGADGQELWNDLTLPYTDSEVRARSLCRVFVEKNRNGLVIQYPAKLKAWPVRVGDRVRVSSAEYGFSSKYFRCTDWQFGIGTAVTLTLEEDAADAYDQADAIQVDPTPNTQLPSPYLISMVTGLTVLSDDTTLQIMPDGTLLPRIFVTWDANTSSYVSNNGYIEISWQLLGDLTWHILLLDGNDTQTFLSGMPGGMAVIVRAVAINSLGVRSNPVFRSVLAAVKQTPPSAVTSLTENVIYGGVQLTWDACPDADYAATELRQGTSWEAGVPLHGSLPTIISGQSYLWAWPAFATYTVWAKNIDTSGNRSEFALSVSVTVDDAINIGTGQLGPNAATGVFVAAQVAIASWSSSE